MISRMILNSYHLLRFVFFHFLFILLASNAGNCKIFRFTNETDQQALLAVKDLITPGDPFGVLNSWNHSLHFCHWKGVTCSRRHQRATVLDLSSLNLAGQLSPQIGNLSFLKVINLQNNSFHGSIPHQIGQLHRLRHLLLQNNSFQGNLPINLSRCLDMRELNLDRNDLGGNIPSELYSLYNLFDLILGKNHFAGHIPPSFGNLSSLRKLDLGYNNLVGNIPRELSLLSNLEYLNLGHNKFTDMVPLALYNVSSIQIFGLNNNQLEGKLPPDLGLTLPNLKGIFLFSNKFSGSFPPSIANASQLATIDFAHNSFIGPLPLSLGTLHNLEELNLGRNQLATNDQPNGCSFLVKYLVNCTNLQTLNLGGNGFRGEIPYSIVNLSTTLTLLTLGRNHLSGSIPKDIGNLVNLNGLELKENMLQGGIPQSIGKLSNLEGLFLHAANISGEIPTSIGNISQLSLLDLGSNMLEGSIPVALCNLTNLQELDLGFNRLTGEIPEKISGLSSIHLLLFDQNQLTGTLTANMGGLKNIVELAILGNRLAGKIPSALGDCVMLEELRMENNLFQGTIPSSLKQLKNIQVMNLSHNNLSGHIPSFLAELRSDLKLDLSHNRFEGEVPTKGVFSNISMFSIVGNLQLCGGIQALHLHPCQLKDQKSFPRRLILLIVILPIVIFLACLAMILYRLKTRSKMRKSPAMLLEDPYPKLSYTELFRATNGFSLTNLIGEGRYGSVYRGVLNSDEQLVAVKVLNVDVRGAHASFLTECEAFRNIRHRNLVKIITSCSSIDYKGNDFKALVLEFMPNGSLDTWLHPSPIEQQEGKGLTLLQTLSVAVHVASAVDYLHHHCHTTIVHCDLKPSNVLLDETFDAHVGDFGLAKLLSDATSESSRSHTSSIGIRGTTGYVPPEYGLGGEASPPGDVYSYGILLLEMFIGKRPTDSMFEDSCNLQNYVKKALPQRVMEIVDPRIISENEDGSSGTQPNGTSIMSKLEVCLTSILQIGILCCDERPKERMDIRDVLTELTRIMNTFKNPR